VKPQTSPTGLCKWDLPDSSLSIIWQGPGSRLMLVADVPGGMFTSIESEGSNGTYQTRKEAQKAVESFIRKAQEQN
jgi:hypothetical protein